MWQLEILSRIIPLFGALAKKFIDLEEQDTRLRRDAQECYADVVTIGLAVYMSGGEWASGMDTTDMTRLLTAFEARFPTKRSRFQIFSTAPKPPRLDESHDRTQFPQLSALAACIDLAGVGGYDECCDVLNQSQAKREQYLSMIDENIALFHKMEQRDPERRGKFLKRIKKAAKHLLDVYCGDAYEPTTESFSLSQHPSHGMKEFADRVYDTLERHWRCTCPQKATRRSTGREARLSLIRHRQLAPKTKERAISGKSQSSAKFEILLPACKDNVEWKVTNVEIKTSISQTDNPIPRELVRENLCQYLRESDETSVVDFLIEQNQFWHLKPRLLDQVNHHTTMETLQQFLGEGFELSLISKSNPQDQLLLCYVLANSMLYFYPSSWLQMEWNSSMVYFIRRSRTSTAPMLTCPYVAVELLNDKKPKSATPHMQCHIHPAILSLGIIFLEIASGTRFPRSQEETAWKRSNSDNREALRLLQSLEKQDRRDRTKRLSDGMRKAIRACLKLEPPANFPSNQLSEEGPIRHYILSCIVWPLADELQRGYTISLDNLHQALLPLLERDITGQNNFSRRSTANSEHGFAERPKTRPDFISKASLSRSPEHTPTFSEARIACSYRDREEVADESKVRAAETWFRWHYDAMARINGLRAPNDSVSRSLKIAILDSGIELSQANDDKYNVEPSLEYHDFVDQNPNWQDQAGHGTHLAVLIRKVVPTALIHVARVFKKNPGLYSASKIAKAIKKAVDDWHVDIIVMSFGFSEDIEEIDHAIQHAANKSVLMFAAASNDGKNRPDGIAWPAKDSRLICVHSADGLGTRSNFTPSPQDSMRIMVLGEGIKSAWPPRQGSTEDHKLMSGTSCAAPIAAGIAALILDYARGFLTDVEWKKLRRRDSILRMFGRMKDPNSTDGYWWIKHWQWFDPKNSEGWIQGEIRSVVS